MEQALIAGGLAVLATVALPIGALLGIYTNPSRRLIAVIMAFGAGALIEGLALELALEGSEVLIHEQHSAAVAWLYVASGFLVGGIVYYVANRALEGGGAHLRRPSLTQQYLTRERHRFADLLHKLHVDHVPFLVRHGTSHTARVEHAALARHVAEGHGGTAPVAIFFGALLDGLSESIVIGAKFVSLATFNPSFLIAVFLSNLPEAMSSASGMRLAGFSNLRILGLWTGLMVASGVFGAIGNIFFATAPPTVTAFANAIAGGGILAMLAATMMPEAYEEGGPMVGLATIAGFLSALLFFTIGLHGRIAG